jgi:CO/xanthine dehydrogenase FAD-binding subunit
MGITVKTFETAGEAAGQLASDRSARFMAGGTLVMRGVNEAMPLLSTIVLARDRAMQQIEARGEQISIGAGVTMSQILASRDLDFLHPAAHAVGGPAIRNMATVGGNLFARAPFGDFATALLVLDAMVDLAGSHGRPAHAAG